MFRSPPPSRKIIEESKTTIPLLNVPKVLWKYTYVKQNTLMYFRSYLNKKGGGGVDSSHANLLKALMNTLDWSDETLGREWKCTYREASEQDIFLRFRLLFFKTCTLYTHHQGIAISFTLSTFFRRPKRRVRISTNSSISSKTVITETPIHSPSCPPISANKFTS